MIHEPNPLPTAPPELPQLLLDLAGACGPLVLALLAAGAFATLRVSLQRSHPMRSLGENPTSQLAARLGPLLLQADRLATSAMVFEIACRAAFIALIARQVAGDGLLGWGQVLLAVLIAVPCLLLLCDALPTALASRRGDGLLRALLPSFHALQLPLRWLVTGIEAGRRALSRMVGLEQDPATSRQIVEGLREVIEETEIGRDLDPAEREMIGNVIEFRDVSVAAVMTPRTAVHGIAVSESPHTAARLLAQCGHSRLPVYEGNLDTIVGFVAARDLVEVAAAGGLESTLLSGLVRRALFVPETKTVSELLAEFRREKLKLAIVLDEYGGTAGIVTLGDLIREIVGEIQDEFETESVPPVRRLEDGAAEVDASLHVSDVNEELEVAIPECEDYETLAGFVLSELGRFPKKGETFTSGNVEYTVIEASERRVLRVRVRPLSASPR